MKAAVCRAFGAPLEIEDLLLDPPGPGEVKVRVAAVPGHACGCLRRRGRRRRVSGRRHPGLHLARIRIAPRLRRDHRTRSGRRHSSSARGLERRRDRHGRRRLEQRAGSGPPWRRANRRRSRHRVSRRLDTGARAQVPALLPPPGGRRPGHGALGSARQARRSADPESYSPRRRTKASTPSRASAVCASAA